MKKLLFLSIVFLGSCTNGIDLKSVEYDPLLNDSNSKVWLVNKMVVNGVNTSANLQANKEIMVFHNTGVVNIMPIKGMGDVPPRRGNYYLNSQERTLELNFEEGERWFFDVAYITEDSILFVSQKRMKEQYKIQLTYFPEF